jgi:hypothetical protein
LLGYSNFFVIQANGKPSWASTANGGAATPRPSNSGALSRPMPSGGTPRSLLILDRISIRLLILLYSYDLYKPCSVFNILLTYFTAAADGLAGLKRPANGAGTPMPTTPLSAMQRSLQSRPLSSSASGAQLGNGLPRPSLFGSTPRPTTGDMSRQRPK